MSAKSVLSHLNGRQVEAFYVLLVSSGDYTFLPELYDIFGRDTTIKFLDVFAGCKIEVPKVEKLELPDLGSGDAVITESHVEEREGPQLAEASIVVSGGATIVQV